MNEVSASEVASHYEERGAVLRPRQRDAIEAFYGLGRFEAEGPASFRESGRRLGVGATRMQHLLKESLADLGLGKRARSFALHRHLDLFKAERKLEKQRDRVRRAWESLERATQQMHEVEAQVEALNEDPSLEEYPWESLTEEWEALQADHWSREWSWEEMKWIKRGRG